MEKIKKVDNIHKSIYNSTSKKLIGYKIEGIVEVGKDVVFKKGDSTKTFSIDMILLKDNDYYIMNSNICIIIKKD